MDRSIFETQAVQNGPVWFEKWTGPKWTVLGIFKKSLEGWIYLNILIKSGILIKMMG